MNKENAAAFDRELRELLGLAVAPIAIAFVDQVPANLARPRQRDAGADGRWPHRRGAGGLRLLEQGDGKPLSPPSPPITAIAASAATRMASRRWPKRRKAPMCRRWSAPIG